MFLMTELHESALQLSTRPAIPSAWADHQHHQSPRTQAEAAALPRAGTHLCPPRSHIWPCCSLLAKVAKPLWLAHFSDFPDSSRLLEA